MQNWYTDSATRARLRARALVLLLLYSGLRISDAVKLEQSRLTADGRLMLRQMKTGNPVYVKLPPVCIEALTRLPDAKYFFWTGESKLSTAVGSARRTIECLGRMTGINAHPHRFRDTFAVNLLLKGVDIRTASLLLGHKSIRTTERHYAPWVSGFQRMLDDAVDKLNFD
jgi:integrase